MRTCQTEPFTSPTTISRSISARRSSPAAISPGRSAARSSATSRVEDAREAGFDEVTVKVGFGAGRKVRFNAVLLGEWFSSVGEKFVHYRVYRGAKKFALHIEHTEYFEMRDAAGQPAQRLASVDRDRHGFGRREARGGDARHVRHDRRAPGSRSRGALRDGLRIGQAARRSGSRHLTIGPRRSRRPRS